MGPETLREAGGGFMGEHHFTSGEVSRGEKMSILGPTQSRISPSMLQYTKISGGVPFSVGPEALREAEGLGHLLGSHGVRHVLLVRQNLRMYFVRFCY